MSNRTDRYRDLVYRLYVACCEKRGVKPYQRDDLLIAPDPSVRGLWTVEPLNGEDLLVGVALAGFEDPTTDEVREAHEVNWDCEERVTSFPADQF